MFIENYHKEMKMFMIIANIKEDLDTTMTRFLGGLNIEIANIIELQNYLELEDIVYITIKTEK